MDWLRINLFHANDEQIRDAAAILVTSNFRRVDERKIFWAGLGVSCSIIGAPVGVGMMVGAWLHQKDVKRQIDTVTNSLRHLKAAQINTHSDNEIGLKYLRRNEHILLERAPGSVKLMNAMTPLSYVDPAVYRGIRVTHRVEFDPTNPLFITPEPPQYGADVVDNTPPPQYVA